MSDVLTPDVREAAQLTEAVQTANGPVRGYHEDVLKVFKGLRYAAAPVGLARFKPPALPKPWREPAEATA